MRGAITIGVLAAVLLVVPMASESGAVTVRGLKGACAKWLIAVKKERETGIKNPQKSLYGLSCRSYIRGVDDSKQAHDSLDKKVGPYCAPGGPSIVRMVTSFVTWAVANPRFSKTTAATGVMAALRAKYPCDGVTEVSTDFTSALKVQELSKRCLDWARLAEKEKQTGQKDALTKLAEYACKTYIRAVHETKLAHDAADKDRGPYCMPADTGIDNAVGSYLGWAKANEEYAKQPAAVAILTAFKVRFPCK